jgi:radical SAM superfamily enzyme YgiQ (UPF0313 family)
MSARAKLVLYLPRRDDPARGEPVSADLLPLELLQIAAAPAAQGYEIVLLDAMVEPDPLARVLEACEGALLFASSCILGYQVQDGAEVARAVRARFPALPIVWGGWFPSVAPELYLRAGIADAVALGQGELAFLEIVQALECGAPLEGVPGLALWRDGQLLRTAARPVVGFERFEPVPWQLLDFARYAQAQRAQERRRVRHRMPLPRAWSGPRPPIGFSFFSSFGCPTDCTFCCSPALTGRRWKAIPGAELADEVAALWQRFGFEALRFQDANWGVSEKRAGDFCERLLQLGVKLHWNATIEIESVQRYSDAALDLLCDSGCSLLWLGAETATSAMQERIRKYIEPAHIPSALERLYRRGIVAGTFWIVGFPGESPDSMRATLREAARVKLRFPGSASEVYPFRAIPGTLDWERARELGWPLPETFEEWGRCFEWKWNHAHTPLPPDVQRTWKRYANTAALYDEYVSEGPGSVRKWLARAAGWRLEHQRYGLPIEQKCYDWYVRLSGQTSSGARG